MNDTEKRRADKAANKLAKEDGADYVDYLKEWSGFFVYVAQSRKETSANAITELPFGDIILVQQGKARFATEEEVIAYCTSSISSSSSS